MANAFHVLGGGKSKVSITAGLRDGSEFID